MTHVFSSDLQRAQRTAQAVIDAQASAQEGSLSLVRVPELRERDFGSAEGKRFGTPHPDAESVEEMRYRAERFVQAHLAPLLQQRMATATASRGAIVVVSHGLLLNSLLRALLTRFAPSELARLVRPRLGRRQGCVRSGYIASWSNTGYVEIAITLESALGGVGTMAADSASSAAASNVDGLKPNIRLAVVKVNVVSHLEGLRNRREGIGRLDSRQRTLDSFFTPTAKRRKAE